MIYNYLDKTPQLDETVFVAPSADVIGDVTIGKDSSIWFKSVVRGDVHFIKIGNRTNVQDGCVLHVTHDTFPMEIGDEVTIGHGVILHGCTIESGSLIGMGAILLDNCRVGKNSLIAAGTLIKQNDVIPPRSLVMGSPGKVVRKLSDKEVEGIYNAAQHYVDYVANYRNTKPAIEEKR